MNPNSDNPGRILDGALNEMRETPVPSGQADEAAARVLDKLRSEHRKIMPFAGTTEGPIGHIEGCPGFRALIPAYLAGTLAPDRTLLWEDHIHECVGCRKALEVARFGRRPEVTGAEPVSTGSGRRIRFAAIGAAAAVIIVAVLGSGAIHSLLWPVDVHAMAQAVNGGLYLVAGQEARAIAAGNRIESGQAVRSGSGSSAILLLADGARIEMGSRSELALVEGRDGIKVRLRRGSVIITAKPEHAGPLYVETPDFEISANGAMFAVSAVARGSRISVIDGEARVLHDGAARVLGSGRQISTDASMETTSVRDEVAWSPDAVARMEVTRALLNLHDDVRQRVAGVGMRFDSELKGMIPGGTVVVASLPNLSEPFGEAYALFKQRVQETDALRGWWATHGAPNHASADEIAERLGRLGAHLGPEILLAFPPPGRDEYPIALAALKDSDAAFTAIQDDLERMKGLAGNRNMPAITVLRSAAELDAAARSATQPATRPVVYLDRNWIAVSSPRQIQRAAAFRATPGLNPFPASPLGARIDRAYSEGVGWLLAADLKQMVQSAPQGAGPILGWLGMDGAEQLLVEQKTGSAGAEYRATLGFSRERHGVAAWIAEPAPMGALEFISPNAYSAAGAVTRDPAVIVGDLFQLVGSRGKMANDLAAPLGNEFLVALDGPILPSPAWRGVIEVNDAARLQSGIENAIAVANRESTKGKAVALSSEVVDGRTFYRLNIGELPIEIHYTFWGGYMVLAPKRTLLMEAIQTHDTGNSLARSPAFRAQLPDGRDTASGFLYQNIQSLAGGLPTIGLSQTIAKTGPSTIYLYGEPDRIVLSGKGVFGMNGSSFSGLASLQAFAKANTMARPSRANEGK